MKLSRRLLSLLLVCFLCFGLFSVNVSASDVNILTNDINFRFFSLDDYAGYRKQFGHTTYVKSSELPITFDYNLINLFNTFPNGNFNHFDIFDFAYISSDKLSESQLYYGDKIILNKGENFKVSVSVVGSYFFAKDSNGNILNQFPLYQNDSFRIYFDLYDGSGNFVSIDAEDFEINLKEYTNGYNVGTPAYYNISANLSDVPFDVYGIRLITVSNALDSFGGNLGTDFNAYKTNVLNGQYNVYRYVNVDSFSLVVDDSNRDILNSIVSWLSNIKENLTNGLSNVTNGLTNLGNRINSFFTNLGNTMTTNFNSMIANITSLGDRISGFFTNLSNNIKGFFTSLGDRISGFFTSLGDRISGFFINLFENIKGLFIPSQGYFDSLSNRFDLLIEERFGALVTITDYLVEFFSSFNADITKEYFDVPVININFLGYSFPIGGWQVRFVPRFNGIEILTNACKFISSVLATFGFFEGLKHKYKEVFGGG